jgi:ppGpp synthetase/RelA/SpoT-type nucleotidyltranferase/8-oxo-dGTP pyrophosphatase MutT (NUDIX family)
MVFYPLGWRALRLLRFGAGAWKPLDVRGFATEVAFIMDTKPFSLSVKMLLRDPAGRYLLLKRSPASKNHAGLWELPGGKIDSHEAFDEALIREVREETGLESRIDRVVGTGTSEIAERTVVYLFLEGRAASDQVRLSDEHDDHRWLYPDELLAMLDEICPQFRTMLEDYCRARGYGKPSPPSAAAVKSWSDTVAELDNWVRRYKQLQPVYEQYATVLQQVLTQAVRGICPTALVQARPKGTRNFAEKILRKNKYKDPLAEITDLCGARVVTHIQSEADAVCRFIRDNFVIDEKNSLDTRSRLGAQEFGYRSVHYIVQFQQDKFPDLPEALYPLKAEIQVRTIPQHAWSDIGHDRIYKSGFSIPDHWQREAARLAALLESADDGFSRLVEGLEAYHCNFGAYLTPDQITREIQIAEAVLKHDQKNAGLVERLARLAISQDNWDKARQVVEDFRRQWPDRVTPELLCCLGSTLCHLHGADPTRPQYIAGREHFRLASRMDTGNVEARVRLAETGPSAAERLRLFREAFDVSPTDPAALGGYVRHRIMVDRNTAFVPLLRPSLEAAIDKCQLQVDVDVNIPWALYQMAAFKLLLGPEHEWDCLKTLCQAVRHTSVAFHLDFAIEAARAMCEVEPQRRDAKSAERLLRLARRARFPDAPVSDELRPAGPSISRPVVIVAGGCDPAHEEQMAAYRDLLRDTFAYFRGTVISGGTSEGISGLVGELGNDSQGRIHTIGYLPSTLPADGTAHRDERYHELRNTDGQGCLQRPGTATELDRSVGFGHFAARSASIGDQRREDRRIRVPAGMGFGRPGRRGPRQRSRRGQDRGRRPGRRIGRTVDCPQGRLDFASFLVQRQPRITPLQCPAARAAGTTGARQVPGTEPAPALRPGHAALGRIGRRFSAVQPGPNSLHDPNAASRRLRRRPR